jgi:hypothetical protein
MAVAAVQHLMNNSAIENLDGLRRDEAVVPKIAVLATASPERHDVRREAEPRRAVSGIGRADGDPLV